jgi:hypothetical protein
MRAAIARWGWGRYRIPLIKTIAISGSLNVRDSRTDTKVYGAAPVASTIGTRQIGGAHRPLAGSSGAPSSRSEHLTGDGFDQVCRMGLEGMC